MATCKQCKHFRRHYVLIGNYFSALHYGHCVFPRNKLRLNDQNACKHLTRHKEDHPVCDYYERTEDGRWQPCDEIPQEIKTQ